MIWGIIQCPERSGDSVISLQQIWKDYSTAAFPNKPYGHYKEIVMEF